MTGDFEGITIVGDRFFLVTSNGVLVEFAEARLTGAKAFNASALEFTPGGRSLVMTAGPQQAFAEIGIDGRPVHGGALDRAIHPQPEGIAFLPDGTLLVSSEGGKGEATLRGYLPR